MEPFNIPDSGMVHQKINVFCLFGFFFNFFILSSDFEKALLCEVGEM